MAEQDVAAQLARIENKVKELEKSQSSAKNAGRLAAVLIAITALGGLAFAIMPLVNLMRDPQPLITRLQLAVEDELVPQAQTEVTQLFEEVLPVYEEAVGRMMEESYPEIRDTLESELTQFRSNMASGASIRIRELSDEIFRENEAQLLDWLPELAMDDDPTKLDPVKAEEYAGRMARVLEGAGTRAADDLFGPHFAAVTDLELAFDSLQPPDRLVAMSDSDLRDYIAARASALLDAALDPPAAGEAVEE